MRHRLKHVTIALLFFFAFTCTFAHAAHALSFNPEEIVPDEDFFRSDDMTRDDVQHFLERKHSVLATYKTADWEGTVKSAADIIWRAGVRNGINPKVLLVLLQKEQSLIENQNPSQYNLDWATGFARCDNCSPTDPIVAAYKGFGMQVEKAAWRKKYYITNAERFNYQKNVAGIIDGIPITPRNNATAALYNYTPHLRGNFSFWKLWTRYFSKIFPDGMIVKESGKSDIWLIAAGAKRRFASLGSFLSRYQQDQIVTVHSGDLEKYPEGALIRFPQYSLLRVPSGAVFLIVGDGKYGIPSKKIFQQIGFNPDEVISVVENDVKDIPTVGLLSAPSQSPIGELLQDKKTGGIYYVAFGKKHPLLERAVLQTNFLYMTVKTVTPESLESYEKTDPVPFADGTLVKSIDSPTVYIISNGQKRPIASEDVFKTLGFQWSRIITSNGSTLEYHPIGQPVDVGQIVDEEFPATVSSATLK